MKTIIKHYSIARLARVGMVVLFAAVMGSCGGGGGCAGVTSSNPGGCSSTGGGGGTIPPNTGGAVPGSVSLVFSNTELKSAGTSGTEVTVTATVKSAGNVALSGVAVDFSANSGTLAVLSSVTDTNGQAKALIGTAGNRTNRIITITAQAGAQIATGTIVVVGTTITVIGPASIASGSTGDFTVSVRDSLAAPVANVPVTFSSAVGNPITAIIPPSGGTAAAPLTNSQGQVLLRMTPSPTGTSDTISFAAQGANTVRSLTISNTNLTVTTFDNTGVTPVTEASTGSSSLCSRIVAQYVVNGLAGSGSVNISTSRGIVFSDSGCTAPLSGPVAFTAGASTPTYVKSNTAGIATVTATVAVPGGLSAQTNLEFIAPLTATSTISLQADPSVIGTNSGTSQTEQSTLTAIVRDGTPYNNLVKNAVVAFGIETDVSRGILSNSSVTTGSNGAAVTSFIAGDADTPTNGVLVKATIQGSTPSISATASLTVSRRALFITAGTGNLIIPLNPAQYKKEYMVQVSDASGNAVPNANVTASIIPTRYSKGRYTFDTATGKWGRPTPTVCDNEDVNQDGSLVPGPNEDVNGNGILDLGEDLNGNSILDVGEDFNGNDILDPGIPVIVTSNAVTDATGSAVIAIIYPRDRATWLEVKMSITGRVSGSESVYRTTFVLPALADDFNPDFDPPGKISPYGEAVNCDDPT